MRILTTLISFFLWSSIIAQNSVETNSSVDAKRALEKSNKAIEDVKA
ncbi:MAG: hypothetical protein RL233_1545, partial [Bacteroidota bacterium]